jgi:hypothetical protein
MNNDDVSFLAVELLEQVELEDTLFLLLDLVGEFGHDFLEL